MSKKLFEASARRKYRFRSPKGLLTCEDLWDLDFPDLNHVAKGLHKEIEEHAQPDFVTPGKKINVDLDNKLDLTKYVIKVKLREIEERNARDLKQQEIDKLINVIADKEHDELRNSDLKDLKKQLKDLMK